MKETAKKFSVENLILCDQSETVSLKKWHWVCEGMEPGSSVCPSWQSKRYSCVCSSAACNGGFNMRLSCIESVRRDHWGVYKPNVGIYLAIGIIRNHRKILFKEVTW